MAAKTTKTSKGSSDELHMTVYVPNHGRHDIALPSGMRVSHASIDNADPGVTSLLLFAGKSQTPRKTMKTASGRIAAEFGSGPLSIGIDMEKGDRATITLTLVPEGKADSGSSSGSEGAKKGKK